MNTPTPTYTSPPPGSGGPHGSDPSGISRYGTLWRAVPRNLGFLLPLIIITFIPAIALIAVLSSGIGLIVVLVGIPITFFCLYGARYLGQFEMMRLRAAGRPALTPPEWPELTGLNLTDRLKAVLLNPDYWRAVAYTFLNQAMSIISWVITFIWVTIPIGVVLSWVRAALPALPPDNPRLGGMLALFLPTPGILDFLWVRIVLGTLLIAFLVLTLPWIVHGMVSLHQAMAKLLLAKQKSAFLREEIHGLNTARYAAASAESSALRKLERDIHDGPQQQLVRLQYDLALAGRMMETEPEKAKTLLDEAASRSAEALNELRALSRGFAPPLLQDRGLISAVESLAERSQIPVSVSTSLPQELRLSPELEQGCYFLIAELLTNAAKHSEASEITITISTPAGNGEQLLIEIIDDGKGGAVILPEHGLERAAERATGLGGFLSFTSPQGGPSTFRVLVPLNTMNRAGQENLS